jgi:hypothetical protein
MGNLRGNPNAGTLDPVTPRHRRNGVAIQRFSSKFSEALE